MIELKRYSQRSIKTYKSILMPFLPHVNGEDIEKLSENDIWDWMHQKLKARSFPYASVKACATTIRLFYRELFRNHN
ncbi:MAG: phage integrase N-terminal SAM-like domain-containing protein [Bacteroidota bacterium]